MKRNIEGNELENVNGGIVFSTPNWVKRNEIAQQEAAERQAEQDLCPDLPSQPAGIVGEIVDKLTAL